MTILASILALTMLVLLGGIANTRAHTERYEATWPPIGRIAALPERDMHYLDIPAADPRMDAVPVVFIHGASGNLRDQVHSFAPLVRGRFRSIYVDRPGAGHSQRLPGDDDPSRQMQGLADLLDHLGVERAVVCGHSYGAGCAAAFAVDHPERIAGLVLLAPASHPWPGRLRWTYRMAAAPGLRHLLAWTLVVPLGRRLLEPGIEATFAPDPVPEGYRDRAAIPLLLRPGNFLANASDILAIKRHAAKLALRYREITAPTLIVTGALDPVVRNTIHAAGLHRTIAHSRLVDAAGVGHKPDYVMARTICDHLANEVERECKPARPQLAAVG